MADRVTKFQMEMMVYNVNKLFKEAKSEYYVLASHRYDYYALDLFGKDGKIGDAITAGTKRDIYNACKFMAKGIYLSKGER